MRIFSVSRFLPLIRAHLSALTLLGLSWVIWGCTASRQPAKINISRTADTLTVALDPLTAARWSPEHDSLVVLCEGCDPQNSRIVEHFLKHDYVRYMISHYQALKLELYGYHAIDSIFVVPGTGEPDSMRMLREYPRHRRVEPPPEVAPVKEKTPVVEKTVKKATILKVSANEGVAIYKDKSKKEVIKIVPKGTNLTLLSREGDMYSVQVGDGEGFVEAEAVEILP